MDPKTCQMVEKLKVMGVLEQLKFFEKSNRDFRIAQICRQKVMKVLRDDKYSIKSDVSPKTGQISQQKQWRIIKNVMGALGQLKLMDK